MKPYKMTIKLTSHCLKEDFHIRDALKHLFGHPAAVRVCIQRLKTDHLYPIPYRLTVWYYLRTDWTPEMWLAETLKIPDMQVEGESHD